MNMNAHTGENIAKITYKGLFDAGLRPDLDTIHKDIHVCTPDDGSNILKAWGKIEGAGCVCHREHNCLGAALSLPCIIPIIKKIKAACAHFHRSDKVRSDSIPFDIRFLVLYVCHVHILLYHDKYYIITIYIIVCITLFSHISRVYMVYIYVINQ